MIFIRECSDTGAFGWRTFGKRTDDENVSLGRLRILSANFTNETNSFTIHAV